MRDLRQSAIHAALRKVIKRFHDPVDVILMRARGVDVDHATVHRWALRILPVLAAIESGKADGWV